MATKKKRRGARRRKKPADLRIELALFGVGALLIALIYVPGSAIWGMMCRAVFGVFGASAYFLGISFVYLAVVYHQRRSLRVALVKILLGMALLSGAVILFSDFSLAEISEITVQPDGTKSGLMNLLSSLLQPWRKVLAVLQPFYANGTKTGFCGGVMGLLLGGSLLTVCGRPAGNAMLLLPFLIWLMLVTGVGPGAIWAFCAGHAADMHQRNQEARRERRAQADRDAQEQKDEESDEEDEEEGDEEERPGFWQQAQTALHNLFRGGAGGDDDGTEDGGADAADGEETDTGAKTRRAARTAVPYPASHSGRFPIDVDLGPEQAPAATGTSEPVGAVELGPGGTFGMNPLETPAEPAPAGPVVILPAGQGPVLPQPAPLYPAAASAGTETVTAQPDVLLPAQPGPEAADAQDSDWIPMSSAAAAQPAADLDQLTDAAMRKPQAADAAAAVLPAVPAAQPAAAAAVANTYRYPPIDLFEKTTEEQDPNVSAELKANAEKLVKTLESFGVKTRMMDISRGPSVTRYELQPLAGVKISRITSLADDIALNLAVADVRIEAPIPGKPAVGIEVPNRKSTGVSIRSIFESPAYKHMNSPLTMTLGKDIAGTAQVADLRKMPHLLIAGSTGSGKSVCVNSFIISFLYRSSPDDVRLILIDPKVVELAEYNGIPHLLMPVVTEPRKAAGALCSAVGEMERRYRLFADNNVRDISTYNKLAEETPALEKLPYIAIVIDELADLMMVAGKEVEDSICRIAQKARAAGMHLIVATQRPSVDVITGLIKANIPSRIAFAVSSQVDSRTILDAGGAEKLLGKGDMLFMPVGASKPLRIQGTYVKDEEITAVLDYIKKGASAAYDDTMIAEMDKYAVQDKNEAAGDGAGDDADDPMLKQCVEVVIDAGQASTSLLQRRCKLGYARAARMMDEMEQRKIIGPYEGAKPRAVLVTRQQWLEMNVSRPDAPAAPDGE